MLKLIISSGGLIMIHFKVDEAKAISAVLYVTRELLEHNPKVKPDLHKVFKILYFADQKHLAKYGRPVIGDYYIAMNYGPVPSAIYDMTKSARGDSIFDDVKGFARFFDVEEHFITPKKEADINDFSETDLECINESLFENRDLTFEKLVEKSHDDAYNKAAKDDKISFREMAKVAGADENMLSYIKLVSDNELFLAKSK